MQEKSQALVPLSKGAEECLCGVVVPVNPVSWNFFASKQHCVCTPTFFHKGVLCCC